MATELGADFSGDAMSVSSGKRQRAEIDMRAFAKSAGATIKVPAGNVIFNKGEAGECMYIVQSGAIEMLIGDRVIETIGANEALGFMSMIDDRPRSSTARAKEACELSLIDARTFRFMVDEVPNFATYIMGVLARRIRGMGEAM
jgi:CRP/FNR family cyclic AMP-dependent transcriptional regulator